jgi:hypothetical protein
MSPGPTLSVGPPSTSTVADPLITTNSSSASVSVTTPGVICQIPRICLPSGDSQTTFPVTSGVPETICSGARGSASSSASGMWTTKLWVMAGP